MKLAVCVGLAALLAGCSSDASRLSEAFSHPFSNPFASSDSVAEAAPAAAPAAPTPKVVTAPAPVAVSTPAVPAKAVASAQPEQPVTGFKGKWTAAGGSPIVVGASDNLSTLSQRYGVPTSAILSANGMDSAAQVKPGARVVIPVYVGENGEQLPSKPKAAKTDLAEAPSAEKAPAPAKSPVAQATPATGAKTAAVTPPAAPQPTNVATALPTKGATKGKPGAAVTDPQPTASLTPQTPAQETAQADSSSGNPEFRWPARGRIIQGFKAGGNDGINISVPEGTSVRAAENGVVAYAGSDLKGYGNLILIRHPNGFVTAYANNSEIDVKRGDTVKRGQVIAKSGSSGNVDAPQLHFELRKNSQPVDPTEYLAGL